MVKTLICIQRAHNVYYIRNNREGTSEEEQEGQRGRRHYGETEDNEKVSYKRTPRVGHGRIQYHRSLGTPQGISKPSTRFASRVPKTDEVVMGIWMLRLSNHASNMFSQALKHLRIELERAKTADAEKTVERLKKQLDVSCCRVRYPGRSLFI